MPHSANIRESKAWDAALEEAKLAALAEFAAGAGHEINNPLAVICGRAELLLRQESDPQRRRDLATIHAQAKRIYEMIADLMLFARPPQPVLRAIDLRIVLSELADELKAPCQERGILLQVRLGAPVVVRADGNQLRVALRAVCDNALEVMDSGGRLEIFCQATAAAADSEGTARIEIRDNGPGFDEHTREHLFDPFYSGRAAGRGLGMGLAKCWRIVRQHQGTIEAFSSSGGGAAFVITLPAADIHANGAP